MEHENLCWEPQVSTLHKRLRDNKCQALYFQETFLATNYLKCNIFHLFIQD